MATLGLDYVSKSYTPKGSDKELSVKIWDTAGQERFRTLTHSFYKQANGVIIAFDLTNEETFGDVRKWIESIYTHADQNICKILVGNKCDLEDERKISSESAQELAKSHNMRYYDASAKNNYNIDTFMEDLMNQVYAAKFASNSEEPRQTITINREQAAVTGGNADGHKKKGCC